MICQQSIFSCEILGSCGIGRIFALSHLTGGAVLELGASLDPITGHSTMTTHPSDLARAEVWLAGHVPQGSETDGNLILSNNWGNRWEKLYFVCHSPVLCSY